MRTLAVELPAAAATRYEVRVGTGLLEEAAAELAGRRRWAVISDDHVGERWARPLAAALRDAGAEASLHEFPAGEASKTRRTVADLQDEMIDAGLRRDGGVVAVGGGVVGDVAGFAAATLFRGIVHVQVPTSLLAMVDSSVGGKTGVDTAGGKNLVGAFHQPSAVFADIDTLETLPDAELVAGLAEVIKHGVILDEELFVELEDGLLESCTSRIPGALARVVERSVALKSRVVAADERETGLRQILNFGHTVGHGIERSSDYSLRHGEAVAVGMVVEARLAEAMAGAPVGTADRIADLCRRAGLPVRLPPECAADAVVEAAAVDKKVREGRLRCALPAELGRMARDDEGGWSHVVAPERLRALLETG